MLFQISEGAVSFGHVNDLMVGFEDTMQVETQRIIVLNDHQPLPIRDAFMVALAFNCGRLMHGKGRFRTVVFIFLRVKGSRFSGQWRQQSKRLPVLVLPWKDDKESRSFPFCTAKCDVSLVHSHDFAGKGQSYPVSALARFGHVVGPIEQRKELFLRPLWYAYSRIAHGNDDLMLAFGKPDDDFSTATVVFHGIDHHII